MAPRARGAVSLVAYVLHHYDWSESSLILDLWTREHGRLAVAAKGAKRPHSQLRAVLLPFQRLHATLGRAATDSAPEVQTLRAAERAGGAPMPTGDALFSGFYCNELLMKLVARNDPHPALFDAYALTLPRLAAEETGAQCALRAFELTLLRETGVLPDLSLLTLTQQPLQPGQVYALDPEAGVSPAHAGIASQTWVALEAALSAANFDALCGACRPALPELRGMLRATLQYHLGSYALHTREVLLDAQRLQGP